MWNISKAQKVPVKIDELILYLVVIFTSKSLVISPWKRSQPMTPKEQKIRLTVA